MVVIYFSLSIIFLCKSDHPTAGLSAPGTVTILHCTIHHRHCTIFVLHFHIKKEPCRRLSQIVKTTEREEGGREGGRGQERKEGAGKGGKERE